MLSKQQFDASKRVLEEFPPLRRLALLLDDWYTAVRLKVHTDLQNREPILVYQMGKVASGSVFYSFPMPEYPIAIHMHTLYGSEAEAAIQRYAREQRPAPRYLYRGLRCYKQLILNKKNVKIITLVRDPISQNISAFFQGFEEMNRAVRQVSDYTHDELMNNFINDYGHDFPLDWFTTEFEAALGVNVYDYDFPHDSGYQRIQADNLDILILKSESSNDIKRDALAEFLDLENFQLSTANVSDQREYADEFKRFKDEIVLPQDLIDKMLDAQYTRHFYSEQERTAIRAKWMKRISSTLS